MNSEVLNITNKILLSIGEPFLNKKEESGFPTDPTNIEGIYQSIFLVIQNRKSPQIVFDKLVGKALLEHVDLQKPIPAKKYGSNILLGFGVDE